MGSVTIIFIIPVMLILFLASSLIGTVTGGDRTEIVLPYEPEKGIVWECDIPMGGAKVVKTEIDGNEQIFYFKGTFTDTMLTFAKDFIGAIRDDSYVFQYEKTYGQVYEILFTDKNGNELKYYAKEKLTEEDSIYSDMVDIYAPGEYTTFEYTVTAQNPLEGEIFWYTGYSNHTECFAPSFSPTHTFTIVHTEDFENSGEYSYHMYYGDDENHDSEYAFFKYKFTDGEVEILEEKNGVYENSQTKEG